MRGFCSIFVLLAFNLSVIHGEIETAANKSKVENEKTAEVVVAPGVHIPKLISSPVVSDKQPAELKSSVLADKPAEKPNSVEANKPVGKLPNNDVEAKENAAVKQNATVTMKSQENIKEVPNSPNPPLVSNEKTQASPQAGVASNNATAAVNTPENAKEVPKPLPSIDVNKDQAHTISESGQSDDQVEYEQVVKRIDVDIESSVQTGFYILMGISVGALLFVCLKINKLRYSRAERKYGVQGNRSNQELAPLPLSMEDPYSDEEDQTLFDINRQQIRIF